MLQKAKKQLAKDPLFIPILESIQITTFQDFDSDATNKVDIMASLLNAIVSQQLSVKAANTIYNRFLALFDGISPSATLLLETDTELLRSVGLSKQKIKYMQEVAVFSQNNDISIAFINQKTNEEVINYLTQIKGVGKWTVEMLLMFTLCRPDVFPLADLGIQQAMQKLLKLDSNELAPNELDQNKIEKSKTSKNKLDNKKIDWENKIQTQEQTPIQTPEQNLVPPASKTKAQNHKELLKAMSLHAEKWKPYRTFAAMYLWKWKDSSK